jgi:hypothetical protein
MASSCVQSRRYAFTGKSLLSSGYHAMRNSKERRKPESTAAFPIDDVTRTASERRKLRDRRIENLNAEERQLLLSEMPGLATDKTPRKD